MDGGGRTLRLPPHPTREAIPKWWLVGGRGHSFRVLGRRAQDCSGGTPAIAVLWDAWGLGYDTSKRWLAVDRIEWLSIVA